MKIWLSYMVIGAVSSVHGLDDFQRLSARGLKIDSEQTPLLNSRAAQEDDASSLFIARDDHELIPVWKRDQIYAHARPALQSRQLSPLLSEHQVMSLHKRGIKSKLINCVGSLCGKEKISPEQSARGPSLDRPTMPIGHALRPVSQRGSPRGSLSQPGSPSTPTINPALLGDTAPPNLHHGQGRGSSSLVQQQGITAARRFSLDRVWSRQGSGLGRANPTLETIPGGRPSLSSAARRASGSFDSSRHSSRASSSPRRLSSHLPFPDPEPVASNQQGSAAREPRTSPSGAPTNGASRIPAPSPSVRRAPNLDPEAGPGGPPASRVPPPRLVSLQHIGSGIGILNAPLIRAQPPDDVRAEIRLPGNGHDSDHERPPYNIGE